jgi:hypothetical protein
LRCGTLRAAIREEWSFMAELENQQRPAEFPGNPAAHGDIKRIAGCSDNGAHNPNDSDDSRPAGRISVISIPRREIARLQGILRLSGLPRHKPTVVFDASRERGDTGDE